MSSHTLRNREVGLWAPIYIHIEEQTISVHRASKWNYTFNGLISTLELESWFVSAATACCCCCWWCVFKFGLPVFRVKYSPSVVDNCIGGAKKCLASSFIKNMLRNMRLLLIVVTSFWLDFLAAGRICCPVVGRFFFIGLIGFCSTDNVLDWQVGDGNAPHALSRFSRSVRWSVTNLIGWRLSLYLETTKVSVNHPRTIPPRNWTCKNKRTGRQSRNTHLFNINLQNGSERVRKTIQSYETVINI